ncbi:hypothetical protein TgHK011_005693 [Trichoderma gracile]|nr:hypothetical protein TgHK011_005693 [Trichoderma gracile]
MFCRAALIARSSPRGQYPAVIMSRISYTPICKDVFGMNWVASADAMQLRMCCDGTPYFVSATVKAHEVEAAAKLASLLHRYHVSSQQAVKLRASAKVHAVVYSSKSRYR